MRMPALLTLPLASNALREDVREAVVVQAADYYQVQARIYDRLYDGPESAREDDRLGRIIRRMATPDDYVVDLGCGTGLGLRLLRGRWSEYLGVDIAPAMIREAARKYGHLPGTGFLARDALDPPAQAYGADLVLALYGVPSLLPSGSNAGDLLRCLAPGGRFVLVAYSGPADSFEVRPDRGRPSGPLLLVRRYTPDGLRGCLEAAGGHRIRVRGLNACLGWPMPIRAIDGPLSALVPGRCQYLVATGEVRCRGGR